MIRLFWTLLALNFSSFINGYANDVEDARLQVLLEQPFVIVPLGGDCLHLIHLHDHGLYLASFPIDWMVTYDFPSFLELVGNDFEDLVNFSLLEIKFDRGTERVLHKRYQIEMPHVLDVSKWHNSEYGLVPNSGDKNEIVAITDKYTRRIERFKALRDFRMPVFFVRYGMNEKEAIALCELLEHKFPSLDFKLVSINNANYTDGWAPHPRIIPEYLNPEYNLNERIHGNRHPAFTRLFTRLGWMGEGEAVKNRSRTR